MAKSKAAGKPKGPEDDRNPRPEQRGLRGKRPGTAKVTHHSFDGRAFDLVMELILSRIALERVERAHPVPEMVGTIALDTEGLLKAKIDGLKSLGELRALGPQALVEMRTKLISAWLNAAGTLLDAFGDEERQRFLYGEIRTLRPAIKREHPGRGRKFRDGIVARELGIASGESGVRNLMKNHADPARRRARRIGLEAVEPRAIKGRPASPLVSN